MTFTTDQSAIWRDVEGKVARMATPSPSLAMSDMYEHSVDSADAELRREMPHLEKQVGFLAFIDGNFAGGEVFGSAALCGRKLQKLLRSYYLDSLDRAIEFPAISVEQIFAQVQNAKHEQFESVGKGMELRFEAANVQGSWKLVDDLIPHLIVFPKVSNN